MSSGTKTSIEEQQILMEKLQIYRTSKAGVSPFWRDKYERDAKKYWDIFYKHHGDRFFKDRHYLRKEWNSYFSASGEKVILEVGCGAGNTIFPLIATYPHIFVYACDFSPRAVDLVKAHEEYTETRVCAFASDLTGDDLDKHISPSSVDLVTMIFVLSAVSPEKMPFVLQNIKRVLKPNGCILFRDYAVGDLAQERFSGKDQKISDNFYVRGDGTRAFYFSNEFLETLFAEEGFEVEEIGVCCKQVENRSRELVMNRRWVQATFRLSNATKNPPDTAKTDQSEEQESKETVDSTDIDISDGLAMEMFGASPSCHEMSEFKLRDSAFRIKLLSKEYQHTCKSTGLMLWESARFMASVLDRNPNIVSGKQVLELGCGCTGICSMIAARSASLVVATDADTKALTLLTENIATNLESSLLGKLKTGVLEWGNKEHIEGIKSLASCGGGFEVIIGTDVTYVAEAIVPLFETAKELILHKVGEVQEEKPALILCHVFRRVDEPSLLSAASKFGFKLVDRWAMGSRESPIGNIVDRWFCGNDLVAEIPSSALHILYFQME
ncbi:S-adenosyl-L-methionine-dependent methyltransferases superfamily protein [Hirschfeldia incana]|nr:S-adenosyl-L-methionine-dependent methyltransferases superfamily protein [Hirschfeldia incana]